MASPLLFSPGQRDFSKQVCDFVHLLLTQGQAQKINSFVEGSQFN
jgi:hypothetical protein